MFKLLDLVGGAKVYIIVGLIAAVAAGAGGFTLAWKLQAGNIAAIQLADARKEAAAVAAAVAQERKQNIISADAGKTAEVHQAAVQAHAQAIRQEVTKYVTPEADAKCILPVGAFRLLDAAATGAEADAGLDAPGQPNEAPSGVDCSRFVALVAEDFALYRSLAAQLNDILDLADKQAAAAPASVDPP